MCANRSLEDSVCKPVCLIFRNLCQMQEDNSGFSVLLDLLAELYQKQPKIGYHLLYYLKARYSQMFFSPKNIKSKQMTKS